MRLFSVTIMPMDMASHCTACRSVLLEFYSNIGDDGPPEEVARLRWVLFRFEGGTTGCWGWGGAI